MFSFVLFIATGLKDMVLTVATRGSSLALGIELEIFKFLVFVMIQKLTKWVLRKVIKRKIDNIEFSDIYSIFDKTLSKLKNTNLLVEG